MHWNYTRHGHWTYVSNNLNEDHMTMIDFFWHWYNIQQLGIVLALWNVYQYMSNYLAHRNIITKHNYWVHTNASTNAIIWGHRNTCIECIIWFTVLSWNSYWCTSIYFSRNTKKESLHCFKDTVIECHKLSTLANHQFKDVD